MKKRNEKDYYSQISKWIDQLESGHLSTAYIPMVTDKIDWCWKFRKITEAQKDNLCNRAIAYFQTIH